MEKQARSFGSSRRVSVMELTPEQIEEITRVGNLMKEFPGFLDLRHRVISLVDEMHPVFMCSAPGLETYEEVRKARDEISNRMISLMEEWKAM